MSDPLGFATNLLGVTTRPGTDPRVFTSSDTWAADCTSAATEDGTDISAEWANEVVGNLRALLRANGTKLDGTTKIVTEDHSDNMILNAALHLLQRRKTNIAVAGGTANALTVTLSPAPAELLDGMEITVIPSADNTGACTLAVNGGSPANIVDPDGAAPVAGSMKNGRPRKLFYIGGAWQQNGITELLPYLRSQATSLFVQDQPDPADIVVGGSTIGTDIQTSPAGFTPLGQFTLPSGYINIKLDADCFLVGGSADTLAFVSIFYKDHAVSSWTFLASNVQSLRAGKTETVMRSTGTALDPTKSYDFIAVLAKSTSIGATPVSGTLCGLALKV